MNKLSISLLTNVLLLLTGIVFLIFYNEPGFMIWAARVVGTLFLLPSVIFLAVAALRKSTEARNTVLLAAMPAVGGTCFGIVMIAKAELFTAVLVMLLGVLLCVLGLFHVIYLLMSRKAMTVKGWYYLLPVAVLACGGCILGFDAIRSQQDIVILLAGISLLLFNVTSLQEHLAARKASKSSQPDDSSSQPDDNNSQPTAPAESTESTESTE